MEFDKYHKRGAYHWRQYEKGTIYTAHVNKVREWVRKGRTLDVGAGDGVITHFLNAEGIDNNKEAVKLARKKGVNVSLGSAYELEGEYDNVILADVLEHLQYPDRALAQVEKVFAKDGLLYIVVPPPRYLNAPPRKYHYQEWTADELKTYLQSKDWVCLSMEEVLGYKRIYGVFKLRK